MSTQIINFCLSKLNGEKKWKHFLVIFSCNLTTETWNSYSVKVLTAGDTTERLTELNWTELKIPCATTDLTCRTVSLFVNSQTPRKFVGSAEDGCLAQDYFCVHLNSSVCFLTLPWNLDLPLAAASTLALSVWQLPSPLSF